MRRTARRRRRVRALQLGQEPFARPAGDGQAAVALILPDGLGRRLADAAGEETFVLSVEDMTPFYQAMMAPARTNPDMTVDAKAGRF